MDGQITGAPKPTREQLQRIQISNAEFNQNTPDLTIEQLEAVKKQFLEDMEKGEFLITAKAQRFFKNPKDQDSRKLTDEDFNGTGLTRDGLIGELNGEQPIWLKQFINGYRNYARRFGAKFIEQLLIDIYGMRGDRLPTNGVQFKVDAKGKATTQFPEGFRDSLTQADSKREGYKETFLFETRIGDVYFETQNKGFVDGKMLKFVQMTIATPTKFVDGDPRVNSVTITAYLGQSNEREYGNPSVKLLPDKQPLGSVAMIVRALQTDPGFLVEVFRKFAPEAFQLSDNKSYYPTKGNYPMQIVYEIPGVKPGVVKTEIKIKD